MEKVKTITVKPCSNEEAEEASFVVCMLSDVPSKFTDNEYGPCSACGREVMFRPYMPKKPPKFCLECAAMLFRNQARMA